MGTLLATCGSDNLVKVWDSTTGKELLRFTDFMQPVTCVEFNSDSTLLCAGSVDKTVRVFDTKTKKARHTFTGHTDSINALSVLCKTPRIVSGGNDRKIKVWDYDKAAVVSQVRYICIKTVLVAELSFRNLRSRYGSRRQYAHHRTL